MISVEEAKRRIEKHCFVLPEEEVFTGGALGRVLAVDVYARVALPCFDNAAMDGFAISSSATAGASAERPVEFHIGPDVKAGDAVPAPLAAFESRRIMTGAPIPCGADAVLEKERAEIRGEWLRVTSPVVSGRHVRRKGEEIARGQLALARGAVVHPGTIGFLSGLGVHRVEVHSRPKVSVVATGSELVKPGAPLREGKIYDSNGAMLEAALEEMRIPPVFVRRAPDRPGTLKKVLAFALRESDVVILSGGVSAGEHDLVRPLLADSGVETVFWKVSQKPGKPLWFGRLGRKLVFGLPGNPASVFTCFYEYVYPALRLLMGHQKPHLPERVVRLAEALRPDGEKSLFLKGRVEPGAAGTAVALGHQQSHMLSSLCDANALLFVPSSGAALEAGQTVVAHSLPPVFEVRS